MKKVFPFPRTRIAVAAASLLTAALAGSALPPASANTPPPVLPQGTLSATGAIEVAPAGCVGSAPAGTVYAGTDVGRLCNESVARAASPAAAGAIRYGFSKLGTPYSQNWNLRSTTHFDCSSFVARALTAGGGKVRKSDKTLVDMFPYFGWTGAYIPGGWNSGYRDTNLVRLPSRSAMKAGDIVIQFNGPDPSQSAGNAGHAMMALGNGQFIQSGRAPDGSSRVSVINYHSNNFTNEWYFRLESLTPTAPPAPAPAPPPPSRILPPGGTATISTGAPNTAHAVNITVTNTTGNGYVTVYPCNRGRPVSSIGNYVPGDTRAMFTLTTTDSAGKFCVFLSAGGHVIVDKLLATPHLSPHQPVRDVDTRKDGVKRPGGYAWAIQTGTPNKTVIGTLTVTEPEKAGVVSLAPCSTMSMSGPLTNSTVNYATNQTIANSAVVTADAFGYICIKATSATHILWDQVAETTTLRDVVPLRRADTRAGNPTSPTAPTVIRTGVPNIGVFLNITTTQQQGPGYATAYPCNEARPTTSNLNYTTRTDIANMTLTKTDSSGNICVYTNTHTHTVVDQLAWSPNLASPTPTRMLDTRT